MTDEPTGRPPMTSNGTPVTDEMLARLADKAEAGFDLGRRAGPALDRRRLTRCLCGSRPSCATSSTSGPRPST